MAKRRKYYVVWRGRNVGVFDNWDEARLQIDGFEGARYKSFESESEAYDAFRNGAPRITMKPKPETIAQTETPLHKAIAVDAACSGNPGKMEYRGVSLWDRSEIFHQSFELGTNNIGEFLAIVHCLAILKKRDCENEIAIYSDSQIAIGWVKAKKCRTKLEYTPRTAELFDWVKRAEKWLSENSYSTKIIKWPTDRWGEIPADFGRKG